MGGAQIDKYGNINATVIGKDYSHPKDAFAGFGRIAGNRGLGESLLSDDAASKAPLPGKG